MKNIIVPTDFSKNALHAFHYACQLAEVWQANLKLIHVYNGSLNPNEPFVVQPGKSWEAIINERLAEVARERPKTPDGSVLTQAPIAYEAIMDFAVPGIVKAAKQDQADLIVMGTTGKHDLLAKAIGSVSTGVAQRAHCPVMLVPTGVEYDSFNNILYASNYASAHAATLQQCIELAEQFQATVHFVHVGENQDDQGEAVEDTIYNQLFKDGDPTFAFNIVTLPTTSIKEALLRYADENHIDLMVLVNRHESFWDNLLGKSVTKAVGLHTKVPLLVYPYE